MTTAKSILTQYPEAERAAYLQSIAHVATADRPATPGEQEVLRALGESAQLPAREIDLLLNVADDPSNSNVRVAFEKLQTSDLKYAFITDLLSFAYADDHYTDSEKEKIRELARYLGIGLNQITALEKIIDHEADAARAGEDLEHPAFLESEEFIEHLREYSIPVDTLRHGLLGIMAPQVFAQRYDETGRGALMDDIISSIASGGTGGLNNSGPGGLSSLIAVLSRGRGYGGAKSMLQRLFGSRDN